MSLQVTLSTPDKTYYRGEARTVVAPGLSGYFGVMERHAHMICAIATGVLRVQHDTGEQVFVVDTGVAEVSGTAMTMFVDEVREARDAADAEEKLQELIAAKVVHVPGV